MSRDRWYKLRNEMSELPKCNIIVDGKELQVQHVQLTWEPLEYSSQEREFMEMMDRGYQQMCQCFSKENARHGK